VIPKHIDQFITTKTIIHLTVQEIHQA